MRYTCLRLRLTSHTDDLPKVSRISESSVGEEVEVLDLVEGRLRVGDRHLRSSGRHAREKGYKGPRHTNENAAPWNAAPHGFAFGGAATPKQTASGTGCDE